MEIETCNHCGKEFEERELEKWGDCFFCPSCIKIQIKKSKKTKNLEIQIRDNNPHIMETASLWASYDIENGGMIIYVAKEDNIELAINHEFLHKILHNMFNLKTCYQLDNLKGYEPFF